MSYNERQQKDRESKQTNKFYGYVKNGLYCPNVRDKEKAVRISIKCTEALSQQQRVINLISGTDQDFIDALEQSKKTYVNTYLPVCREVQIKPKRYHEFLIHGI